MTTQMISVPKRGDAAQVADLLGVSAQRISQLKRRGEVRVDGNGTYDVEEVARRVGRQVTTHGVEAYARRLATRKRIASKERGRTTDDMV